MTVVDERAAENYQRPIASIPRSSNVKEGYRDISYAAFSNAINRCANWIWMTIGTSSTFEPLVYLAPNDFRYQILAMAAIKTGHVVCIA